MEGKVKIYEINDFYALKKLSQDIYDLLPSLFKAFYFFCGNFALG